eukprot:14221387-Ditylum_brightwellii.AAC.1
MHATPQAMQQTNLQQQHPGQEKQQSFYPAANTMMQRYQPIRRKRKNNKWKRQPQQRQYPNQRQQQQPVGLNANQKKYCCTHGACSHWGPECWNKVDENKDAATFQNKMGGSTKNCS